MSGSHAAHRMSNALRYRPADHESQCQTTPAYVLDPVRAALRGIELDPCTLASNPCGADRWYWPPAHDGLAEPWDAESIYVNPPYGKAREPWVRRCMAAAAGGARVVLLVPAATDTRIWQDAARSASGVVFVKGRVKFGVMRENFRQAAASHPSSLIGWNVDMTHCAALGMAVTP